LAFSFLGAARLKILTSRKREAGLKEERREALAFPLHPSSPPFLSTTIGPWAEL
jgi:hypothetical protein